MSRFQDDNICIFYSEYLFSLLYSTDIHHSNSEKIHDKNSLGFHIKASKNPVPLLEGITALKAKVNM